MRRCRYAAGEIDNAQQNSTCVCGRMRGWGARGRMTRDELEPQNAAGHGDLGDSRPFMEKTMSQPALEMTEVRIGRHKWARKLKM